MKRTPIQRLGAGILAAAMACMLLAGCSGSGAGASSSPAESALPAEKTDVHVFAIKGPTGVGMVNLMKAQDDGSAANDYTFTVVSSPDEIVAKISNREADIAAIPTNLAANLYQKTKKIQILAVNTLGVLHILENGESIGKVADLKGKTIYSTGQGSNPEYILRYVLQKNDLDPEKDVTLRFTENDELATLLASGEASVAMVPEPTATTVLAANDKLRRALDVTAVWDQAAGDASRLMMGCVVARSDFVAQHPEAVAAFLDEYEVSISKTNSDLDGTAALCETYGIIPKAAVAKKAIPGCNVSYVDGTEMKSSLQGYFAVLYQANPKSIGGALPDDAFYYSQG